MVSARDLRDMFEEIRSEAGKRASDFVSDAKASDIGKMKLSDFGRRSEPPGIVWLGVGLVLGAVVGVAIALIAAPYPGDETRRRLVQQVDKMKRPGEEGIEQIHAAKSGNGGTQAYTTPTTAYERS
ncbi:MAG: YtxH domain-containing protein [Chloroflexi bacterium]|nr:MAG: YtxH domain-containing protein [Chloroflexota bacterium]